MNRAPDQNATAGRITLDEIRALMQSDPPVGAEVAEACRYDARVLASCCGCSLRRLEQVFHEAHHTPRRWLREQRLLRELGTMEYQYDRGRLESIKRFASEIGYRRPGDFDRAFKMVFQTSPEAFLAERAAVLKRFGIEPGKAGPGESPYLVAKE